MMVEYVAYGKQPREIADVTGYSEMYVRGILRSPLFQTEVAQAQDEIKRHGLRKFAEALVDEVMPSLTTMTTIRDSATARDTDRVTAADKIIGRALDLYAPKQREGDGKRTVKLVIEGSDLAGLAAAIRDVDGQLPQAAIEAPTEADIAVEIERIMPLTIEEMIARDNEQEGL
jgi:hypothetical protein